MPRLRKVNHLCSSNLSVNCEYFTKKRNGNPTAVPLFGAVAGLWSAPDPLRGKGRYTRGWKPQVSTLLCAARRQCTFRSLLKRRLYIIGIGEEKTLEISTQYNIIKKLKFQCLARLCSQGVLFFALRHRRGRKNNVQNQVRLPAGVPAADLCGRSVLPICILRTHRRAHAYLRRGTTGDFGRICWIMSENSGNWQSAQRLHALFGNFVQNHGAKIEILAGSLREKEYNILCKRLSH